MVNSNHLASGADSQEWAISCEERSAIEPLVVNSFVSWHADEFVRCPTEHPRRRSVDIGDLATVVDRVQTLCHLVHDDGPELVFRSSVGDVKCNNADPDELAVDLYGVVTGKPVAGVSGRGWAVDLDVDDGLSGLE